MNNDNQRIVASVRAKGTCAALDGLTRDDNPYILTTKLGKRWAREWLQAYNQAEHGVTCDACSKWLAGVRQYHVVYSNGFNYFLCIKCELIDVKPPELVQGLK
jgi:hypothetical protein